MVTIFSAMIDPKERPNRFAEPFAQVSGQFDSIPSDAILMGPLPAVPDERPAPRWSQSTKSPCQESNA